MAKEDVLKLHDDGSIELFGVRVHLREEKDPFLIGSRIQLSSVTQYLEVEGATRLLKIIDPTWDITQTINSDKEAGDLENVRWVGLSAYYAAVLYLTGGLTLQELEKAEIREEDGLVLLVINEPIEFGPYQFPVKIGAEETIGFDKGELFDLETFTASRVTLTDDNVIVGTSDKWHKHNYSY
jgi:hypothetical protein